MNVRNYLRATIPTDQTELTFCFFYGPNAQGPLQAATNPKKQAWILSGATGGKISKQLCHQITSYIHIGFNLTLQA